MRVPKTIVISSSPTAGEADQVRVALEHAVVGQQHDVATKATPPTATQIAWSAASSGLMRSSSTSPIATSRPTTGSR